MALHIYALWDDAEPVPVAYSASRAKIIAYARKHHRRKDVVLSCFPDCATLKQKCVVQLDAGDVVPLKEWWPR